MGRSLFYSEKQMALTTVGILMMLLGAATLAAVLALYIYEHSEFR